MFCKDFRLFVDFFTEEGAADIEASFFIKFFH